MSPVSRGRKGKQNKKSARRSALPDVFDGADVCDCPACSDADFDPQRLIDELVVGAADLVESEDPLEAEVAGAAFVSIGALWLRTGWPRLAFPGRRGRPNWMSR